MSERDIFELEINRYFSLSRASLCVEEVCFNSIPASMCCTLYLQSAQAEVLSDIEHYSGWSAFQPAHQRFDKGRSFY